MQKLVLTKPEYDADTDTNPDHQTFNSEYDTLKYYSSGYVDVVVSGANAEVTVDHNLGFIPFFTAFVNGFAYADEANYNMVPGVFSDFGFYALANVYADSSKLYFRVETNSATGTFRFYYKIFRNKLDL